MGREGGDSHTSVMKQAILNFLYNLDRAIASLFGAPPQETISSELGRHETNPLVDLGADLLDDIQANHTENAEKHATLLDNADNGFKG